MNALYLHFCQYHEVVYAMKKKLGGAYARKCVAAYLPVGSLQALISRLYAIAGNSVINVSLPTESVRL